MINDGHLSIYNWRCILLQLHEYKTLRKKITSELSTIAPVVQIPVFYTWKNV